jgi:hypothetical protein
MEEYLKKAEELGLRLYTADFGGSITLTNWYKFLIENEEFEKLFTESERPLSSFFRAFEPPVILVFALDEEGSVWNATWLTGNDGDVGTSAYISGWTREDMRGSQRQYDINKFIYSMAFTVERLLRNLRRMGYNIVGNIPNYMAGEDCWMLYLTKENFENSERFLGGK